MYRAGSPGRRFPDPPAGTTRFQPGLLDRVSGAESGVYNAPLFAEAPAVAGRVTLTPGKDVS